MSFLPSRFFRILLISVRGRLLLKRMSLLQIPAAQEDMKPSRQSRSAETRESSKARNAGTLTQLSRSCDKSSRMSSEGFRVICSCSAKRQSRGGNEPQEPAGTGLGGITFVSCVLDDLVDQLLLVVGAFHLTETTETPVNLHPSWGEASSPYLVLCRSFILYRRPELFFSRSS